jgi:hypothetical protein
MAKLVDIKTAAEHLGIPENTLRKGSIRGQFPFILINGRYFYDTYVLDKHIQEQMISKLKETK